MFTMFTTKTISLKVPHAQQTRTKRSTARFTVYSRAVRTGLKLSDLDAKRRAMFDDKEKGRILIQEFAGDMFAMNNKCSHLGLPLQGKTPLFSAECTNKGEIVCAAHGTMFKLTDGNVSGEWCPKVPVLPIIGKPMAGEPKKAEVYKVTVSESGEIILEL